MTEVYDRLEELRRRDQFIDAAYKTAGIVAMGSAIYLGWWLYDFFTNANIDLRNKLGSVAEMDFPPVDPWLATKEAADAYGAVIGATEIQGETELYYAMTGYSTKLTANTAKAKLASFIDAQRFIDPDTGAVHGYTTSYYMIKEAEDTLVKAGKLDSSKVEPMHPVDAIAKFVVHDKMYWGGVLGLASVPPLLLAMDTLEGMGRHEGD